MGNWRTHLVMYMGTEGMTATQIVTAIESVGFRAELGPVDFVYDWKDKIPVKDEVFALADKLAIALKGSGVIFNLDTHD